MKRISVKAAFILALSLLLGSTVLRGGLPPAQAQIESPGQTLALSQPALSQDSIGLPAKAPADWWTTVQKNIRQSEYHVTWQDQTYLPDPPAAYQAPNCAHNLRTYFIADASSAGIRVIPRTEDTPS